MRRSLVPAMLLTVLALLPAARAGDDAWPASFVRLARDYRPEDIHRLPAIRARLERELPDALLVPLPRCPLRSALAKALPPGEVRETLARIRTDPARTATYLDNLAARTDLAELVLAEDVPYPAEREHGRALIGVALNAMLDGDSRLVLRLLASEGVDDIVERLCRLSYPQGLRLLADVVVERFPLSRPVRARLATVRVYSDWQNPVKPLGEDRAEALLLAAGTDSDPAMRALAARVLLRSNDPRVAARTVRAFVAARSVALDDGDWHALGKFAPSPVLDESVSLGHRLRLFESWLLWTWDRAEHDVPSAEARAAALRPALARAGPRLRGEMILDVGDHAGVFIATIHGRQRPVPSFAAILDDLARGRPGDAPAILALGRAVAARIRSEMSEEDGWPEVRVREEPIAAEAAWRPAPREREAALAGVACAIRTPEQFASALETVGNQAIPAAARLGLFEELLPIVNDGPDVDAEDLEDEEQDGPLDPGYFEAMQSWISTRAPRLDSGLAEAVLTRFADAMFYDLPEALHDRQGAAFRRALEKLPAGGPRLRLRALERRRYG